MHAQKDKDNAEIYTAYQNEHDFSINVENSKIKGNIGNIFEKTPFLLLLFKNIFKVEAVRSGQWHHLFFTNESKISSR